MSTKLDHPPLTTHLRDVRPIPSDATLVWLASERAAPLFRTLDRTRAFVPLVVLLAVLPPVLATFAEVMTAEDAAWGLRALDATGSPLPPEAVGSVDAVVPAEAVRPAALRLSAGLLRLADPVRPVSTSLASLLGGAALLGLLWPLAKSLAGQRFAFWVVLMATLHPTLTALLLEPVPVTAALALAVAALWGHLNIDGKPLRVAGGVTAVVIAVAAGLLLTGTAALTVPIVIAADAAFALSLSGRGAGDQKPARGAARPVAVAFRRLGAALAGVAVWAAVERVLPDYDLLAPSAPAVVGETGVESAERAAEAAIVGPLWGLAAIGLGRLLRIVPRRAATRVPRPVPRMLLVWILAAGGAILWAGGADPDEFDPAARYVIALASLPLLFAAAYAIEEASRRLVSGAWVLLAIALPLAVRFGSLMASLRPDGPAVWAILVLSAAAVAWVVAKIVPAVVPQTGLRRGALMAAILAAIALNSADGLAVLFRPGPADDDYRRLIAQLMPERNAAAVVLLAGDVPPPELTYALRAIAPDAAMEIAPSWDEAISRLDGRLGVAPRKVLVAAWGDREGVGAVSGDDLRPVGEPLLFAGRELLLYDTGGEP